MCTCIVGIGTLGIPFAGLRSLPSHRAQDTKTRLYKALPVPADLCGRRIRLRCFHHVGVATIQTEESGRDRVGLQRATAGGGIVFSSFLRREVSA